MKSENIEETATKIKKAMEYLIGGVMLVFFVVVGFIILAVKCFGGDK